jgi:hypothetical protein
MKISLLLVQSIKRLTLMARAKLRQQWEYPPMPYLEQVLNHCSRAGQTYVWLWKHADDNKVCHVRASHIAEATLISKATFKHSLRALCREGLLSFQESDDIMEIELTGWDDEDDQ